MVATALALYRGGGAAFPRGASRLLALAATVAIAAACAGATAPARHVPLVAPAVAPETMGVVTRADLSNLASFDGSPNADALYAIVGSVLGMRTASGPCGEYLELRIGEEIRLGGRAVTAPHEADEWWEAGSAHVLVARGGGASNCAEPKAASAIASLAPGDRVVVAVVEAPPRDPAARRRPDWLDLPRVAAIGSLHDVPRVAAMLPPGSFSERWEQWLPTPRVPPVDTPGARARLGGAPRFVVAEKAVTDRALGVVWQRQPHPKPLDFREAELYCEALDIGGRDDWRLPTLTEAQGLMVPGKKPSALPEDAQLERGPETIFWTRTDDDGAWVGDVDGGYVISTHYDSPSFYGSYTTRCARSAGGGVTEARDRFAANGEELVDGLAGLAWHVPKAPPNLPFAAARAHCDASRFGGRDDWRLPSPSELYALIEGCPRELRALRDDADEAVAWTSLVDPEAGVGATHEICDPMRSLPSSFFFGAQDEAAKDPPAFALCVREAPRPVGAALTVCPDGSQPKRSKTEVRCENAGSPSGPYRTLYPSGAIFETGTYEGGRRTGAFITYHEHGGVYARGTYVGGALHGEVEVTRPTGHLLVRERFDQGRPAGMWQRFDVRGREIERIAWVEGEPGAGRITVFEEQTGKKALDAPTLRGWKHGVVTRFDDETGGVYSEETFAGGWAHGPYRDRDGEHETVGQNDRGEPAGEWINKKAGRVWRRTHYRDGETASIEELEEGKPPHVVLFANGMRTGKEEVRNDKGVVISRVDLDAEATGTIKSYDESGALTSELPFKKGVYHGHLRRYRADGTITSDQPYRDGRPHGVWVERDDDGKLRSSMTYVAGILHGPAERYRFDGRLEQKGNYENGKRVGTWTFASLDDKPTFEVRFVAGRAVGGSWER